jgi:hypothetical protein
VKGHCTVVWARLRASVHAATVSLYYLQLGMFSVGHDSSPNEFTICSRENILWLRLPVWGVPQLGIGRMIEVIFEEVAFPSLTP